MDDEKAVQLRLAEAIETLNDHNLMRIYSSSWWIIWTNFLRGLAFGLGSVIGASILVYITVQVLAQIEFIPILGDWALRLISEIEKSR
ncbi:MAG: DUF5665 domain-containing protein [Proteobacteria bacterium]|nr:hypothetical protein [Paracoccaceae bacterium]MDA0319990.1 DUF5665 domain-containing protein [Pseudomonadota bacterium]MDA0852445.1 DUF5665 domain-containing protein [Pseudomonadota bacterium]MDA1295531.1 DUF5665 domain-containing protein [Pseudomonadota bacterium]